MLNCVLKKHNWMKKSKLFLNAMRGTFHVSYNAPIPVTDLTELLPHTNINQLGFSRRVEFDDNALYNTLATSCYHI